MQESSTMLVLQTPLPTASYINFVILLQNPHHRRSGILLQNSPKFLCICIGVVLTILGLRLVLKTRLPRFLRCRNRYSGIQEKIHGIVLSVLQKLERVSETAVVRC
ncbi:hypothetical protein K440DRAFT_352452 [Wilcoxina mikolae CBS 423.85]|nr:hypothetical protein K440DRAFT_352452 [Wilcoxina mikolae CBS 423.85]